MQMNEAAPSLTQWKGLLDQAFAFKQIAPWTWMTDDLLFGVQDLKSGEIGYCCVIGNLGEVYGLIVYKGTEGLAGCLKLYELETPENNFDAVLSQHCLKLTFEDREDTKREDREILKNLGLKLRGRNAYPVLRNMSPGYYPWFVTADEADFLRVALEQAAGVCLRYKADSKLFDREAPGSYFVRTPEDRDGDVRWHDTWLKPEPLQTKPASGPVQDDLRLRRILSKAARTSATWEFDYAYADMPVRERKTDRPFFPLMLLVIDQGSGLIYDNAIAEPHSYQTEFAEGFLKVAEKMDTLPQEVQVVKDEAAAMLEPILSRLNVKLRKVKKCGEIEKARQGFKQYLTSR